MIIINIMNIMNIIIITITIITITIIVIVIIIIIPYEDKLMLLSVSAYLPQRVVDLLIPYEDKLMWLPHLAYLLEEWWVFGPLWKQVDAIPYSTYLSEGVADVDLLWR